MIKTSDKAVKAIQPVRRDLEITPDDERQAQADLEMRRNDSAEE